MIRLGLRDNQTSFSPGDNIAGAALWEFPKEQKDIEVRLVWCTRGKGTEDGTTVAVEKLDATKVAETGTFSFTAPDAPYSFNGTLIAVIWAVELVAEPSGEFERIEITIAPGGKEIVLPRIEQPKSLGGMKAR